MMNFKRVPAAALRLATGPFEFAAGEQPAGEHAIKILARSPDPIEHWYWGKIAHDMMGMKLRKEVLPLDYCHISDENVGYADRFDASTTKGLFVDGKLISTRPDDRAAEIIARGTAGVPYEASIDFRGPMRLEELADGQSAQCNGRQFDGPGTIVREWLLNGVAVCPFGADSKTRTQFALSGGDEVDVELLVNQFVEAPVVLPVVLIDDAAARASIVAEFAEKRERFVRRFGSKVGSKFLTEGLDYEQALEAHLDRAVRDADGNIIAFSAEEAALFTAQQAEIARLQGILRAVSTRDLLAEQRAYADVNAGEPPTERRPVDRLVTAVGENLAKFAAGIKMPPHTKPPRAA